MNRYGYVGGMPTYWLDPSGLSVAAAGGCTLGKLWAGAGCAAAGSAAADGPLPFGDAVGIGILVGAAGTAVCIVLSEALDSAGGEEHQEGARESTREKHEDGQARRQRDRGGERGDRNRRLPRRKPRGWKGPWPPVLVGGVIVGGGAANALGLPPCDDVPGPITEDQEDMIVEQHVVEDVEKFCRKKCDDEMMQRFGGPSNEAFDWHDDCMEKCMCENMPILE